MKTVLFLLVACASVCAQQKEIPFYEMPAPAEKYTAGAVASRVLDGLGFRFYWATEGLRETDIVFTPSENTRSITETVAHIYEMSIIVKNATTQTINTNAQNITLPFEDMRSVTLENLKVASDILRNSTDEQIALYTLKVKRGEQVIEYPFWNQLNGPIADCLWHVGQIVSFRRLSGNPFSEKVNVFSGTVAK